MKERFLKKGTMLGRHPLGAKIIAFAVAVMMVATMLPASAFVANAETIEESKIVDNSTVDEWERYFTDSSTEYAGGIWTDKSVFKSGADLDAELASSETHSNVEIGSENFLVTMSTLATNKEIVGYSTIPTDTMLILDVSQSMDNSQSIPDMVAAANDAITRLQELNKNNRVGVILYSGNHKLGTAGTGTATLLLPLGRYVPEKHGWPQQNERFLKYESHNANDSENNGTRVAVGDNVTTEKGGAVANTKKDTEGGTYIQNGIDLAMDQFLAVKDVVVGDDNIQQGERRMPVFVLMSDGAPTSATEKYTNIGTSTIGNGSKTTAGVVFVTQLTAAYARTQVENHYNNGAATEDEKVSAKFYTLGLNLSDDDDDDDTVTLANSVLDPKNSVNAVNSYWRELFRAQNNEISILVPGTNSSGNNPDKWVTVKRHIKDGQLADGLTYDVSSNIANGSQLYVDRYFKADNKNELTGAFADIVDEIILQSAYYPTELESGDIDLTGYVTLHDEVGQFMDVKNVHGILLGDTLYTGSVLTKLMGSQDNPFGNNQKFTELGWELVESVAERLNTTNDVAIDLLKNAWVDGQLSYTSDNVFSNYIGWYESADGNYVKYWNEKHTAADVPARAKYISKSYLFYGSTLEEGEIVGGDMMHIIVKVRTDIATGNQEVVFEIPASLIPVITYHIELDSDSYDTAQNIKMTKDKSTPIRLLFEVGLKDDINELNIDEKLAESNLVEGQHVHKNNDGSYYFYSNQWGNGDDYGDLNPQMHTVAESIFDPSKENERYYYTEDSTIYVEEDGKFVPYTGANKPTANDNTKYYRYYRVFKVDNSGKAYIDKSDEAYDLIHSETLQSAERRDGEWYIPEGTVCRQVDSYHIAKLNQPAGGNTGTLAYSRYAVLAVPNEADTDYNVYSYLGNNGRLTVTPATGLQLEKNVDDTLKDYNGEFTFKVTLNTATAVDAKLTKGDSESKLNFKKDSGANTVSAEVTLKAGEKAYITDLPAGVIYTVEELINGEYRVNSVTVNGNDSGITASGTIASTDIDKVVFNNTEAKNGNLIIRKAVTHDFETAPEGLGDKEFTATVTLTDAAGAPLANATFETESAQSVTTDENGVATITVKDESVITIKGVPEGTKYAVAETDLPEGFNLTTAANALNGTVTSEADSVVTLVNDYEPKGLPEGAKITVNLDKTIKASGNMLENWDNYEFSFKLEKLNDNDGWTPVGGTKKVTGANRTASFEIAASVFDSVGTHYFRVVELENAYPEIINDEPKYFAVEVIHDVDSASLKVDKVRPVPADNGDVNVNSNTSVDVAFENDLITEGEAVVNIPIEKHLTNSTGVDVSLEGFEFALYQNDAIVPGTEVETNAAGEAVITLTYDADNYKDQPLTGDGINISYVLKEISGSNGNMTYDSKAYAVTVNLKNVSGRLVATLSITPPSGTKLSADGEAVFVNEFKLPATSATLSANKILNGYDLEEKDFTFGVYKAGADFVITDTTPVKTAMNDSEGNISFGTIENYTSVGTYYYVVKEMLPEGATSNVVNGVTYSNELYYVMVNVEYDEETGKLVVPENGGMTIVKPGAGVQSNITFTNNYKPAPTNVKLSGTKVLEDDELDRGEFEFELYNADEDYQLKGETPVKKVGNNANGGFEFNIDYDKAGTYYYVVKEAVPNDAEGNGVTYDDSVFNVEVAVTDDGNGTLTAATPVIAEIDGNDDEGVDETIIFKNKYVPAPASINLEATKMLEGKALTPNAFTFGVYETDADFVIADDAEPVVTANNGVADGTGRVNNGKIKFDAFDISAKGTYYYVIKEMIPQDSNRDVNMEYDTIEYQVTANVYDVGGKLASNITYAVAGRSVNNVVFSNAYWTPAPVFINLPGVTKNLSGRAIEDEEFEFELYEAEAGFELADDAEPIEVQHNEGNEVAFDSRPYTLEDLGDNYYVIKEVIPKDADGNVLDGVTYDPAVYGVVVTVTNDELAKIEAEVTKIVKLPDVDTPVSEIKFNNTYAANPANLTFGGTKTLNDKKLAEKDFKFALYETDETYSVEGKAARETVTNGEDGKFTFSTLNYKLHPGEGELGTGTYYYVIKEVDTGDQKVTYDATEYKIKVDVYDDGKGNVSMDVRYGNIVMTQAENINLGGFDFTNGYNPDDAVINLTGTKLLKGRDAKPGEFTFELYETGSGYKVDSDAKLLQSKVTDRNNSFEFDSIVYDTLKIDESATYYYVVKEYAPEDKQGVTYDAKEYKIKAVVENDGSGALSQLVTIDGVEHDEAVVEFADLNFTNDYKATLPEGAGFVLEGQKNVLGDRWTVGAGEFTFTIAEVIDLDGKEIVNEIGTATAGAGGEFRFEEIDTYEEPGIYKYRVAEVAGNAAGMSYDETVYDVTVEVTDNGEGDLVVGKPVITANGSVQADVEFNNVYDAPDNAVQTGDDMNLYLYVLLMLMALTGMAAAAVRRRTN